MNTFHPTMRSKGFSLLEVLIALAILSVSIMSLYNASGVALRSSRSAEVVQMGTLLARAKMAEIMMTLEEEINLGSFPDEKEEKGEFDKPFDEYRWSYQIKKVQLPSIRIPEELLQSFGGGGEKSKTSSTSSNPQTPPTQESAGVEQAINNLLPIITKKISEATRELQVKVYRGNDESPEDQVVLTTHLQNMK